MSASEDTVGARLLAWYDRHARTLPWRSQPGTPAPEPYRVWLSEVMLQQTTTAAVAPYYARFLDRWPPVGALASADDFVTGPLPWRRDAPGRTASGFALRDGNYLSARWPGDAHRFAQGFCTMLADDRLSDPPPREA